MSPVMRSADSRSACAPFHMKSEIDDDGQSSGSGTPSTAEATVGRRPRAAAAAHGAEPIAAAQKSRRRSTGAT